MPANGTEADAETYDAARFDAALQAIIHGFANEEAIKALAEGSRQSEEARANLAHEDVLKALVRNLQSPETSDKLLDPLLRCLGNACADNNDARDVVASLGFSWVRNRITSSHEDLGALVLKVLYNICSDHEGAQQRAYRDELHWDMVFLLCDEEIKQAEDNRSTAIDLLLWISGQKPVQEMSEEDADKAVDMNFLNLPFRFPTIDIGDFCSVVESILCFIRDPLVQKRIIVDRGITRISSGYLWRTVDKVRLLNPTNEGYQEQLKLIKAVCTSLVWCLSDIAARPEFATSYPLDDEYIRKEIQHIHGWGAPADAVDPLKMGLDKILLTASCEIVGNLLWALPPESYGFLVEKEHLERPLLSIIARIESDPESAALIHSAAGLLMHLSRPSTEVRETMASDINALRALERLCRHDMKQIQQDGAKLLRALGKDSKLNQERFAELGSEVMVALMEEQKNTAGAAPS